MRAKRACADASEIARSDREIVEALAQFTAHTLRSVLTKLETPRSPGGPVRTGQYVWK